MSLALRRAAWVAGFLVAASHTLAQSPTYLPAPPPSNLPVGMPPNLPAPQRPMMIAPNLPALSVAPIPSPTLIDPNANALYQRIVELYGAGKYNEALPLANRYVASIEHIVGNDHLSYASAISLLARLHQAQGHFTEAETLIKRALFIHERELGPEHSDIAGDLDALAQFYEDQGRLDEAEPLFRRALAISENAIGSDPANVGRALNNIAWLYQEQGRYAEAEPLAMRALSIIEKALGPKHADYGRALDTLAKLYERQSRIKEAEPIYQHAVAVLESSLGPEHESVAATRENLGGLIKSQGRLDEAEPLLKKALGTKERVFGADHPNVANSLAQLGDLYRLQGRADEAEPLFRRALAIRKATIREVPVFFATNRKREKDAKAVAFGGERSETLTFGQATVMVAKPQAVPRRAQFDASLSRSALVTPNIETTEVARLAIRNIEVVPDARLCMQSTLLRLETASVFPKQIFVFVHGFNVSFENALRRAAQIAYDLNFDGAPFLFSWPSRSNIWSYASDRESAEIAVDHLKEFLEMVAAETQATKIHLIAHSMGNIVLLDALEKIKLSNGLQPRLRFAEIILHSPDVASDRFSQLMRAINGLGTSVTLYASTSDRALNISAWVWGVVGRAGAVPSVVKGVETIDVTAAGSSFLGLNHDLYATNPAIFNDMRLVLELGTHPPDKRSSSFEPTTTADGTYWSYRRQASSTAGSQMGAITNHSTQSRSAVEAPPLKPKAAEVPMPTSAVADQSIPVFGVPRTLDSEPTADAPMPPAAIPPLPSAGTAAAIRSVPKVASRKKRVRRDFDLDWYTKLFH
jgi:esterase/lipase superfamily enzyme